MLFIIENYILHIIEERIFIFYFFIGKKIE